VTFALRDGLHVGPICIKFVNLPSRHTRPQSKSAVALTILFPQAFVCCLHRTAVQFTAHPVSLGIMASVETNADDQRR
jgi:hypothetical protein